LSRGVGPGLASIHRENTDACAGKARFDFAALHQVLQGRRRAYGASAPDPGAFNCHASTGCVEAAGMTESPPGPKINDVLSIIIILKKVSITEFVAGVYK
jgi:hypothetical protein